MAKVLIHARTAAASISLLLLAGTLHAEDFYEQQLRLAKGDLLGGRIVQATDELRIAAFGFLERPPLLSEALVRLALAQSSLGQTAAAGVTANRFVEVERHLSSYSSATLEPQTRSAFESLLLRSVPRSDTADLPGLERMSRPEVAKVADLPIERRSAAYEEGARKSPRDMEWPLAAARDASSRGLDDEAIRWSRRALKIEAANASARGILAHSLARTGDCREALAQLEGLSAALLSANSQLAGDQLLCLVQESRWGDAEAAAARLPEREKSRAEVARGLQILAARQTAPTQRPGMSSGQPPLSSTPVAPQRSIGGKPAPAPASIAPAVPTKSGDGTPQPSVPSMSGPSAAKSAEALAAGKALIRNNRHAEAASLLGTAVTVDPANRSLRLALLEAAAVSRKWIEASAQVDAVGAFRVGEETSMFYAAVTLYELGRKAEARSMMIRARPSLVPSPLVTYYSKVILNSSK